MRTLFAVVLLLLCMQASAHTLTDTWWQPDESGWGANVVHENNLLVVTLFVHDDERDPHWYTAALTRYGNTQNGDPEFTGALYESTGSAVGTPWRPQDVHRSLAGSISFRARPDGKAELEYLIDGVTVVKHIERYTTQPDRLEGLFFTSLLPRYDSCPAGFEGLNVFERGAMTVLRDGADRKQIHMVFDDGERLSCSIHGTFYRHGRSGDIRGSYACSDGGRGGIEFRNIEFNSVGFVARFQAEHPVCAEFSGILSGISPNL